MSDAARTYVDVILPVAVPNTYTYHLPQETISASVLPGMRVCVQFGKRRLYTAIVVKVHVTPPAAYDTKPVVSVLDDYAVVHPWQFGFWEWIAGYYMCTRGEVLNAALPNGLRPDGQSHVFFRDFPAENQQLKPQEEELALIIEKNQGIEIDKLSTLTSKNNLMPVLRSLADKGIISFDESLETTYRPKYHTYVKLHENLQDERLLGELLNHLERRAPKQLDAMLAYIEMARESDKSYIAVLKSKLASRVSITPAAIKGLIDRNVLVTEEVETSRLLQAEVNTREQVQLNNHQQLALESIQHIFIEKEVVLLHGVTSSGKTEIYIRLIDEQIKAGRQVLYLLPEIALTTQIIERLRRVFGNRIGIYHSKYSDSERVEVWNNLLGRMPADSVPYDIILGVRSSVFLPFSRLGLVIVDEEHENTYKQHDPSPRYHARDTAIVLAGMHKAKILLGTATPSLESYMNTLSGKYGLVELNRRYLDIQLPEITISNVRDAQRRKQMSGNFSPLLITAIQQALQAGEQVILFQNRRGFAPYLECNDCNQIPSCKHCDVSLTYHKAIDRLICHYCGYSQPVVKICNACGSHNIQTRGFGTEKVEDDMQVLFPQAKLARLDFDSTRKKKAYEEIIEKFASGEINILIGTQMVSKGLDFDNVSVVGILNADTMLNFPDFRAHERSFQLMAQVSGRAGRKKKQGKVIIQTYNPAHEIINQVISNNYSEFFNKQLNERKSFLYPPFVRLIRITVKHTDKDVLNMASKELAEELRKYFAPFVLGPEAPLVGRIQNWHIRQILIKLDRTKNLNERKTRIQQIGLELKSNPGFSTLQVFFDADPY